MLLRKPTIRTKLAEKLDLSTTIDKMELMAELAANKDLDEAARKAATSKLEELIATL